MSQKRPAFEYEEEIRAFIPVPPLEGQPKPGALAGQEILWDPGQHVESVAIHPEADGGTIEAIRAAVAAFAAP